jgi:hypothetical protein
MGLFDSILVEYPLVGLPQDLITRWGSEKEIVFQTKYTPDQYMSLYKIDADGKLWYEERETEWVDPENPDGESIMDRIGHMKTISKAWKQVDFSGVIRFYEHYSHPEHHAEGLSFDTNIFLRFEYGWIEYTSLFKKGKLIGDITLIEHKEPKKLSDEEFEERITQNKKRREENEIQQRKHRKKYPTAEQRLIDNIDRECQLTETVMDEFDLDRALSNIEILIKEYRTKHDTWYE